MQGGDCILHRVWSVDGKDGDWGLGIGMPWPTAHQNARARSSVEALQLVAAETFAPSACPAEPGPRRIEPTPLQAPPPQANQLDILSNITLHVALLN